MISPAMSATNSIADSVRAAGIVGAGGAGFPTHVKFAAEGVDTVIANGAECEPLLGCDKAVMRVRTAAVLRGLSLLREATGADRAVIALKAHYHDVVDKVRSVAAAGFDGIEVVAIDNYYPAGDEQVLVHAITGRVVPEGGIPLEVGVVVSNVLTLSQVDAAVNEGRPVTRRALTGAGEVARPLSCELPVGAPMVDAVRAAGGATVSPWVIVEGGPMMGQVVEDPEAPVTKTTSGVIVLSATHPLVLRKQRSIDREVRVARSVCCQCRMCTDLCPRYNLGHAIQPHLAMRALVTEGMTEDPPDQITAAYLCCLCGACEVYACTLGLSPRKVFESLRGRLAAAKVPNPHRRRELQPHDFIERHRLPLPRLIARLGLTDYQRAAAAADVALDRDLAASIRAVRLPLRQHIGAPARAVVQIGQQVEQGELIGEIPDGALGARVHASVPGVVTSVDPREVCIERRA